MFKKFDKFRNFFKNLYTKKVDFLDFKIKDSVALLEEHECECK